MNIDSFIKKLSEYKSTDTVNNMYYGDSKNAIERRNRLKNYLSNIKNPVYIFVGEAPGYKGCARTGVPFTSDDGEMSARVMNESFKKELPSADIYVYDNNSTDNTDMIAKEGEVESTEVWGRRKLAYPIQKNNEGYYVLINFSSNPEFIDELNRVYNITDEIIKHIIVKKD